MTLQLKYLGKRYLNSVRALISLDGLYLVVNYLYIKQLNTNYTRMNPFNRLSQCCSSSLGSNISKSCSFCFEPDLENLELRLTECWLGRENALSGRCLRDTLK